MQVRDIDKYIAGMVHRLIRSYQIDDFKIEGQGSDYIADMMQEAHLAVLSATRRHPKECKDAPYLKRVITNALIKDEQRQRTRRLNTANLLDEPDFVMQAPPNGIGHFEASMSLETLIKKANLSDSESLVLELKYGFGRGEDIGECNVAKTASLCGRSEGWVRARILAANIKLQVAAEPSLDQMSCPICHRIVTKENHADPFVCPDCGWTTSPDKS